MSKCSNCDHDDRQALAVLERLDRLHQALAPSDQAVELRAARAVSVTDKRPTTAGGRLVGWSLRESSGGAAATVIFRAGSDNTGTEIGSCTLAAGESARDWFGPAGIDVAGGLFIDVVAGAVAGAVYLGAVD